jgi:hypothetical protein
MNPPTHPVTALIEKIQSTNNGYLFSPTHQEIVFATEHPTVFKVDHREQQIFPYKISLKK